ncbi:16S rRNA processing protein RimM [Boudabousia tangfeifanii]|uniref:Ribosome maturation factor RimM n=2 Tax=Boudabousia tangfeifanii TaxID=1912795 RepID=A0A1D9MK38_9ACTO|nr:16S rRNA processing protein RimM [Boudabousia tangfeifanii]
MELTVAVIGAPVGLKGYVRLDVRTDSLRERFAPGNQLNTNPAKHGPLTVQGLRKQGGSIICAFKEITDRTAAQALTGVELLAPALSELAEDEFYPYELEGLLVKDLAGNELGTVNRLVFGSGHDYLEVTTPEGEDVLVPFVKALVPEVDLEKEEVVMDPPGGLFPGHGTALEAR